MVVVQRIEDKAYVTIGAPQRLYKKIIEMASHKMHSVFRYKSREVIGVKVILIFLCNIIIIIVYNVVDVKFNGRQRPSSTFVL